MDIQVVQDSGLLVVQGADKDRLLMMPPLEYHSHFHSICRNVYGQIKGPQAAQETSLCSNGFEVLTGLAPTDIASRMSESITAEISDPDPLPHTLLYPTTSLRERIIELTEAGFTGTLEAVIENYFGCFFRIDHLNVMKTRNSDQPNVSSLWHRDFEPASQLHVVLHLTESGERDANTIFTTIADSRRCAMLGYAYPLNEDRVEDINAWLPEGESPVDVVRPHLNPGDAAVFAASRILHRGQPPERWDRDVVLFNVLPSLVPWSRELDIRGTEHLFEPRNTVWMDPFSMGAPSLEVQGEIVQPAWARFSHLSAEDA